MPGTPYTDLPKGSSQKRGMGPVVAGLILVVLVAAACFFAFTKANPFDSPYQLKGVFTHVHEIKTRSPVRIAGVQVGRVTEVKALPESRMALVTMPRW
jgi:ABC-type transporter Mla subunit MlaD